ncbi:MAG: gliding motility-associated C-terminal domain-containing protein [Bacteroidales bacterium]|nr:gliding motility-associated C-terminal domain-containing protein [Bacteroidales bacterium]
MQYIENRDQFVTTHEKIGTAIGWNLQLAIDGRIYGTYSNHGIPFVEENISVIHEPWQKGNACNFQNNVLNVSPAETTLSYVNILLDYLYRFEFEGHCEGEPFQFTSNFIPEPDSIQWKFNDPNSGLQNNISYELNPIHVFSDGGEYEVEVDVWYPSGRFEHTSRVVEVEYAPWPDLGPNQLICHGDSILLNGSGGPGFYQWSTGETGDTAIYVSDTGWYWVHVRNTAQCSTVDSVHIGFTPPVTADTNQLVIVETSCSGATGSISGLVVDGLEPLTYQWINESGQIIDSTLDIFDLPVGNYALLITDSLGCLTEIGPYTINDAGNIQILEVEKGAEHCSMQDGFILITALHPSGFGLQYSIDNGSTYQENDGNFGSLTAGNYIVRLQDSLGCETVYTGNPVIIGMTQNPQIDSVNTSPATDGQNNGSINIFAQSSSDSLTYDNDLTTQLNNGLFENLAPGYYTCTVTDQWGCDTTFTVEVGEEITIKLEAIAGQSQECPGQKAYVPLTVNNFKNVKTFSVNLLYVKELLQCEGYANAHPMLADSMEAFVYPAEGRINIKWSDNVLDLPDSTVIAELVFATVNPGYSQITWEGQAGNSYFKNLQGLVIPVEYQLGNVRIYNNMDFWLVGNMNPCQGEPVSIYPTILSSNGAAINYWTFPDDSHSDADHLYFESVAMADSGTYSILLTDTAHCSSEQEFVLEIRKSPVAAFENGDTLTFSEQLEIDAGPGQQHYQWSTGDSTQSITITQEGWYKVELTSQQGCTSIDSVYALNIYLKLYIPNAFSPNGDGMNDEFKVVLYSSYIPKFSMEIYNRWGQLIYESKNPYEGWNGKVNGKDSPQGAYVYRIVYEYIGAGEQRTEEVRMGSFVLVR